MLLLVLWSGLVVVAVGLLLREHAANTPRQVLLLGDEGDPSTSLGARAQRWLLLVHLSLQPAYPWIFLAPYVFALISRFPLERGRLLVSLPVQAGACVVWIAASYAFNRLVASIQPDRIIYAIVDDRDGIPPGALPAPPAIRPGDRMLRLGTNLQAVSAPGAGTDPGSGQDAIFGLVSNLMVRVEAELGDRGTPGLTPNEVRSTIKVTADSERATDRSPLLDPNRVPLTNHAARVSVEVEQKRWTWHLPSWLEGRRLSSVFLDLFAYASLVGVAHAVHFQRRYRERERRALSLESHLVRARLHALQAQLQPHFLFNALNSVTALLREDPRAAEEMLVSLSELLRLALRQSEQQEIPLRDELRFLDLYLEIQRVRFGGRLRFDTLLDAGAADCLVPALLLQPLVENAIRHGIEPAGRPGCIRVSTRRRGGRLELKVEDDGLGCDLGSDPPPRLGVGLKIVRARLEGLFGTEAHLEFPRCPEGGFAVRIDIPVRHDRTLPSAEACLSPAPQQWPDR